jgi:hypothetical protein
MTEEIPEDMTEIYDADVPRVDLVGAAANGIPRFLIAKGQDGAGLFDPGYVRNLIAKSEPETTETVTMSGSPAAIAALIHGAPVRKAETPAAEDDVAKAEASTKSMNDRPDSDFAYVEPGGKKDESGKTVPRSLRHFPIYDAAHVRNALSRAPQSPFGDKAMPKIRAAAKKFDIDVSKETAAAPEQTEVTKDMDMPMDDEGGMDPTVVLAEPEETPDGDAGDPGSPAWEAIDAATARKWTAIAARLRSALGVMADRESLEAATVDPDDAEAAMDLDDAACAVDYVIDTLAGFAVDEQAEADDAVMAMVGKSIGALDTAHLDTVESLGAVRKAGRTLSASNESALRQAIQALQQILASLPAAPVTKEAGEPVAKTANEESDMPTPTPSEDVTAASGQEPAMGAASLEPKPVAGQAVTEMAKAAEPAPVAKAEKTPQVAIYDANGNLVGTVDPAEITMLAPAKAPEAAAKADDGAMPEEPAAPAAEAPAATPTDLTPAPAASVGTPADAVPADDDTVAKAADTSTTEDPQNVLKGSITELVKAAYAEQSAPTGELIKSLEDRNRKLEEQNAALVKHTAALEERLTKVENQPAVMAIASNGAIPPAHLMRGQDHGAPADISKAQALRTAFKATDDAPTQQSLARDMNALAIEQLQAIHAAGPR